MSTDATKTEDETGAPSGAAHAEHGLDALERYKTPIIIVVVAFVAVGAVFSWLRYQRRAAATQANSMYATATTPEQYRAVVRDFPNSDYTPLALLSAARIDYHNGNVDRARASYDDILETFPEHRLAIIARLGKIHCLEAQGNYEDALSAFADFAEQHADHPLAPSAIRGRARCLAELGKLDDARIVCEDFIQANPENPWKDVVESDLSRIKKRLRALADASG